MTRAASALAALALAACGEAAPGLTTPEVAAAIAALDARARTPVRRAEDLLQIVILPDGASHERSEATGGGRPTGSAVGAGGRAHRGIDAAVVRRALAERGRAVRQCADLTENRLIAVVAVAPKGRITVEGVWANADRHDRATACLVQALGDRPFGAPGRRATVAFVPGAVGVSSWAL